MLRLFLIASLSIAASLVARADTFDCRVERKFDSQRIYPQENLERFKPRVVVRVTDGEAQLSRCSISPSAGGLETCDEYVADEIIVDSRVGISKYYYFDGQFDVQIWPNGFFVENNGRATISFGTCIVSPTGLPHIRDD